MEKTEISGFAEYLATLAPDPGPILWLRSASKGMFPMSAHSSACCRALSELRVWVMALSGSGGLVLLSPVLGREPDSCAAGLPATRAGAPDWRPAGLDPEGRS